MIVKKMLLFVFSCFLLASLGSNSASAGTFDENFYILINASPAAPQSRINAEYDSIVTALGQSNYIKTGLSVQTTYLSLDNYSHQQNYNWDPFALNQQLKYSSDYSAPVLVHLNAGSWSGDVGLMNELARDTRTTMWDTNNWDMFRSIDQHNYMTYSRKNLKHYAYKKRNIQQVASRLLEWRNHNPDLFIGISLDSELWQYVWDSTRYSDYNPLSITEWIEWLRGTGMYDPVNGEYKGEARNPVFSTITDFNTAMGTSFASWSNIDPPRIRNDGNAFWEEWSRWRTTLLTHHLQDMTNWLIEAGLPANKIYTHQNHVSSGSESYYLTSSILRTAAVSPGSLGITLYGTATVDTNYMKQIRGYNKNWGVPEYNPEQKTDKAYNYDALEKVFANGAHYISPLSWNDPISSPYEIKGTQFEAAMKDFIANYGNIRRPAQFDINAAGTLVYDFVSNFGSATVTNSPHAVSGNQTVGGVTKNSVFLHAPSTGDATAEYSNISIPNVSNGERINLALHSGLADGADGSDGYIVKVLVNGTNVFTGDYSQPYYSLWHYWEPAMIDLTAYAGQTVNITLASNKGTSNDSYDWVVFGTPALYKGSPDYSAPSQVSNATALSIGSKRINLSWADITGQGVAEYKVYRSTTSGFTPGASNFVAFSNTASYDDSNLTPSTTYYYKISALDEAGNEGAVSSQVSTTTGVNDTTQPSQVTGVDATLTSSKDSVVLSWNAGTNIRKYEIYRSTKSTFTPDSTYLIQSLYGNGYTSFTDNAIFDNKTYYYQIIACNSNDICSPTSNTVSVVGASNTKVWSFNTSGDYEGWIMANDVSNTSVNGQLNFTISGADPYIMYTTNLELRGKRNHYVRVNMKNNSPATSAQLFWTTNQNSYFSGSQALTIPVVANDSLYRTYLFDIGNMHEFAGVLQNIRLDFNASSGSVSIDSIEVIEGPDLIAWEFLSDGNAEGWVPKNQIDSATVTGGKLELSFTNRENPYMDSLDNLKLPAKANHSVRMYAKNSTDAFQAKIQWITDTDTTWDNNKSHTIAINPNDPNFTDYIFPVGANGTYWSGNIKQLRISPFSSDGSTTFSGTMSIDRIAISGNLPVANAITFGLPGNGRVDLYWAQNRGDTGANVFRSTSYNGLYTKINDKPVSMHYEDMTVTNGQTYYYKIQYTNSLGSGIVGRPTGAMMPSASNVTQRESNFVQYQSGIDNWYYQSFDGTSYSDMTHVHDQTYNDYWTGGGAKISRVSQNAVVGTEAVVKWVSPITGSIIISGRPEYIVKDRSQGDGSDLKIMLNGTQLWAAHLAPTTYNTEAATHSIVVSVNAGDIIYFLVNAKSDDSAGKESIWWNPQITY